MHGYQLSSTPYGLMRRSRGHWNWIAFRSFHAFSIRIANVWLLAHARWLARTFQALLGDLWHGTDQESRWCVAGEQAVHLATAFLNVEFAVTGAFGFWFFFDHWSLAVGSWYADTLGISQIAFLTEASDDAVLGAHGAWMWVGAGGWAGRAAWTEHFVGWAFRDWWHHHHLDGIGLRALFLWDAQSIWTSAQMSLLACTAWDANTWADWVGIIARAIASLALTEFFVLLADLWWQWHGHGGWHTTFFGWYTDTLVVLQETRFAEAANHALQSTSWAWMRISARGSARRSARQEDLVFFAL